MQNKIVAITGANAGLGKETALALAKQGAHIVMFCRNAQKAEQARQEIIAASGNAQVDIVACDLNDLHSVRKAASEFKERYAGLDVLINNAGFMTLEHKTSANGFEATFAVNYLAHVLLTLLLLDRLKTSAPSRIINVSSGAHKTAQLDIDDLMLEKSPYKGFVAYGNSKLANLLFTYQLAKQLQGTGVTVNALDPGMVDTEFGDKIGIPAWMRIFTSLLRPWVKQPPEGALTSIKLASDPALSQTTGTFWKGEKQSDSSARSKEVLLQNQLHAKALLMIKTCLGG